MQYHQFNLKEQHSEASPNTTPPTIEYEVFTTWPDDNQRLRMLLVLQG